MSKPFEFGQTVFIFLALIGVCVWIGMILAAKGESKLEQSCKPIELSTQFLHQAAFALVGNQPTWTLYVQRYLMSGCYYFFSVLFSQHEQVTTIGGGTAAVTTTAPVPGDTDAPAPDTGGIHY
ncbi:MAG: hypothetical protein GC129_01610 [Proteobacteria bacterium]|nr:hypothetical protein [Pseudomonadota bacterium]